MFYVMTYRVLAIPVTSFLSMVSLMSVVIDAVPMGITLSMVGGGTMLPMATRKSCPLVAVLAISLIIWMTIVWVMSQWGQQPSLPGDCVVLLGVKRDVIVLSADCIMPC